MRIACGQFGGKHGGLHLSAPHTAAFAELTSIRPFLNIFSCDVASVGGISVNGRQVNNYDGDLLYNCPGPSALTQVTSNHNNHNEDRVYVHCACFPSKAVHTFCFLLPSQSQRQRTADLYVCPLPTTHRWYVYCRAMASSSSLSNCVTSAYVNNWDGTLDYNAPSYRIITGLDSCKRCHIYHSRHLDCDLGAVL